jgi:regulator of cell morphogenesis and NO signaling
VAASAEAHAAWLTFSPADLVDHLEPTHHHDLKQELPRLDALAQGRGDAVPADSHPEFSHEPAQLCLRLNPNTDRRDGGRAQGCGGLLARLRDLTNGYQAPADTYASTQALMMGLTQLEADTHLHVHKENNHFFPLVTALEEGVCTSAASLHRVGASQKQELPGALVLPLRSLADGWPGPTDSLAA